MGFMHLEDRTLILTFRVTLFQKRDAHKITLLSERTVQDLKGPQFQV